MFKIDTIILVQAVGCAQPHESFSVLMDGVDGVVGQTIVSGITLESDRIMFFKAEGKMVEQEQGNKQISEQSTIILETFRGIVNPQTNLAELPPQQNLDAQSRM